MVYLIGTGQSKDRAVYYSDERTGRGEMIMTNVERAKAFSTMEEAVDYIKIYSQDLRYFIIEVAEVTLEKINMGYKSIYNGNMDKDAEDLYYKFNRLSYIMNAE